MMRCQLIEMDAAAAIIATTQLTWFGNSQGLVLFMVGTVPDSAAASCVCFPIV